MDNFKLQPFIDAAEELLRADETIRALNLIDNLPAYYRDYIPKEIAELKRDIQKRIATANFYATSDNYELSAPDGSSFAMEKSLRGMMIIKDVEILNAAGYTPFIGDFACGEYWLPQLLDHKGLKFTYFPIYVNHPSYQHFQNRFINYYADKKIEGQPTIFFAGEVIEHLWQEDEVRYGMERWIGQADIIHVSTPCYTFDTACKNWRDKGDLGHLRAYTPMEFTKTISDMFKEYFVVALQSQILHARGVLKETQFEVIKETMSKNILGEI